MDNRNTLDLMAEFNLTLSDTDEDSWCTTSRDAGSWYFDRFRTWFLARPAPEAPAPGREKGIQTSLLKRIDKHLSDWLDAADCECEYGHTCGRAEVEKTRDEVHALAVQDGV